MSRIHPGSLKHLTPDIIAYQGWELDESGEPKYTYIMHQGICQTVIMPHVSGKSVCTDCGKIWDIPWSNLMMMYKMMKWNDPPKRNRQGRIMEIFCQNPRTIPIHYQAYTDEPA